MEIRGRGVVGLRVEGIYVGVYVAGRCVRLR